MLQKQNSTCECCRHSCGVSVSSIFSSQLRCNCKKIGKEFPNFTTFLEKKYTKEQFPVWVRKESHCKWADNTEACQASMAWFRLSSIKSNNDSHPPICFLSTVSFSISCFLFLTCFSLLWFFLWCKAYLASAIKGSISCVPPAELKHGRLKGHSEHVFHSTALFFHCFSK